MCRNDSMCCNSSMGGVLYSARYGMFCSVYWPSLNSVANCGA